MEKTTIQIHKNTLERLKQLKRYEQQSYDEALNSVFDELEEETLTLEEINEIQHGLEDIKKWRVKPIQQVAKEPGIRLI